MSIEILKKGKSARDAEKYLKLMHQRLRKETKLRDEKNLVDPTPIEKYIKNRQELIELERIEDVKVVKKRSTDLKTKSIKNLAKARSQFSEASKIWLHISELKEKIIVQEQVIAKTALKIEKLSKPQHDISSSLLANISSLESEIASAESRLNLLVYSESIAKKPAELDHFAASIKNYSRPSVIVNTPVDAWKIAPSEIRDILTCNYKEIKELEDNIETISKILDKPVEDDKVLQDQVNEKIDLEKATIGNLYQKKLQKQIQVLTTGFAAEIKKLHDDILGLKQSLAISHLKNHKIN